MTGILDLMSHDRTDDPCECEIIVLTIPYLGLDFEHAEGFQLTFAPLVTSQGVSITIIDDQIVEPNERFLLSLEAPNDESPYFIGMPSTLRVGITDTDG